MKAEIVLRTKQRTLRIPLGEGSPNIVGGLNGWDEVERPDGRPLTEWTGADALKVDVPIMLNGWPRDSVEREKDRLIALCRRKDGEEEPPSFKVTGPLFFSGMRMVLAGVDFDAERTIRNGNGKLLRLAGVLHLMEYVKADQIRIARRKKGSGKFTYTTRKGDTVRSIALQVFHDASLIGEIKRLNNIRDPRKVLEPGRVLILPGDVPEFGPAKGDG